MGKYLPEGGSIHKLSSVYLNVFLAVRNFATSLKQVQEKVMIDASDVSIPLYPIVLGMVEYTYRRGLLHCSFLTCMGNAKASNSGEDAMDTDSHAEFF